MSLGGLFRTGMKLATKYAPKIGKAFGQINSGGKKFGTVLQEGRKFGTAINNLSGGKVGNSKFGKDISGLVDKADTITNRVVAESSKAQNELSTGMNKLNSL